VSDHTSNVSRLLSAIIDSSDDAIVSKDLNGIVLSWNPSAERMFGYTADEMIGSSIRRIIPDDRQSEEDNVLASIRAGRRVDHFETVRRRRDGRLVPISLTVSPVLDDEGRVIGASKIARDISDRKRAEEQAARVSQRDGFLAEIALTLTQSRDYEETLRALARAAVPSVGDYCAIDVTSPEGELVRLAVTHVLPAKAELAEDVWGRNEDTGALDGPQHVVRTCKPAFVPHVTDETILARTRGNPEIADRLRSLGLVSYLCVPMAVHDHVFGAITLANAESGRIFTSDDVRLVQDVAQRAALAIENAQSYHQLQSANRLKDEFLATLSHELRTPLNAVLGYARMLKSGAIPADKAPQALDVIDRNAGALAQIVEDVLDVSRIILGKARIKVETIDVGEVVMDAVATVTPAADAKGVRLTCAVAGVTPPVSADPSRLQQVVWNLLSNAVKFTPRGGRVDVELEHTASHVDIIVRDTGIGFPPSFLPHIFERFRQAESGTTRIHGGLGLGLAIARHIVELHGGTIQATSEGEGKGSTFRVTLPLATVPAETPHR
jgi:PAS domain S-box-containing protein